MLSHARIAGLLVLGLAAQAAAQQVHVVAPFGTPGGEFTSVQAAANAAADGDTLLILPGNYDEQVVLEDRQLVLAGVVGPAGQRPTLSSLVVQDLGASRSVLVRGLQFKPFLVTESLAVLQCAGPVELEDCLVDEKENLGSESQRVVDSDHVVFTRCTLRGSGGASISGAPTAGHTALTLTNSSVSLYACDVAGGAGLPAQSPFFPFQSPATAGGTGLVLSGGTLFVAGGSVRGGHGGDGVNGFFCLPPANGGTGLVLDGTLRRLDTTIAGGTAGALHVCGPEATSGPDLLVLGGSVTTIPQTLRRLVISSPVEPGGSVSIDITGAPSEPVILLQALAPLGQWLGGLKGTLAGAPPYTVFALGSTGADGALHLSVHVPAGVLPPRVEALAIVDQLVTPAQGGGGLLSSPSALVLVNDVP